MPRSYTIQAGSKTLGTKRTNVKQYQIEKIG